MHVRTMSDVQKELVRQVVVQTKKKKKKDARAKICLRVPECFLRVAHRHKTEEKKGFLHLRVIASRRTTEQSSANIETGCQVS